MVGSPWQTSEHLAEDLLFLKELNPQMVGIGPFIPHHDTPFAGQKAGTLELTLFLLGLIRLMLPGVLLPATTALGTIAENDGSLAFYPVPMWSCQTCPRNVCGETICCMTTRSARMQKLPNAEGNWNNTCSPSAIRW